MESQLSLFSDEYVDTPLNTKHVDLFPLDVYDKILVSYSGGKDSLAGVLYLLQLGVPKEKLELWHQAIDGCPFDSTTEPFMDWPVTESYVKATGEALGIPVRFQWREGGFKGELLRENRMSWGIGFQAGDNMISLPTLRGKISTRRKFPAKSPNLAVRWCSANLKIDVFTRALNNYPDLKGNPHRPLKVLVFTGERREESQARAKYLETEVHRCNTNGRIVHQWRCVIDFKEDQIWSLIEKHRVVPHPAYILGWNRTSCFGCIFSTPDLYAMMREIAPNRFNTLLSMEKELGFTIDPKLTLEEMADRGSVTRLPKGYQNSRWVKMALEGGFTVNDFFTERWELPAGAFRGFEGGSV